MAFDKIDINEITEARAKAIRKSIRVVSAEELKKIGETIFPYVDDPWRDKFFDFIAQHRGTTFHHAITHDHVEIIYCANADAGMWFIRGTGMGPLQAKGRKVMKEAGATTANQ